MVIYKYFVKAFFHFDVLLLLSPLYLFSKSGRQTSSLYDKFPVMIMVKKLYIGSHMSKHLVFRPQLQKVKADKKGSKRDYMKI